MPQQRVVSCSGINVRPHRPRIGNDLLSALVYLKCNHHIWFAGVGRFWVTIFKMIRRMLLDRCPVLSVWPVSLSLTLVYYGQTAGRIKMPLNWYAGRSRPRPHCARWEPSSPSPKRGCNPQFSADVYCGQTVAHLSYCWALVATRQQTTHKLNIK